MADHSQLPALVPSDDEALDRYLRLRGSGGLAPARDFDRQLGTGPIPTSSRTLVSVAAVDLYHAGVGLALLDRELRRATVLVRRKGRIDELPRPLALADGRLRIREASAGSLDILVDPLGAMADVLLSHPVQLLLTAGALIGWVRTVRGWVRQSGDLLADVSARQALEILREFGRGPTGKIGEPSEVIDGRRRPRRKRHRAPEVEQAAPAIPQLELPDGSRASANRIVHVRIYDDGTQDILTLE